MSINSISSSGRIEVPRVPEAAGGKGSAPADPRPSLEGHLALPSRTPSLSLASGADSSRRHAPLPEIVTVADPMPTPSPEHASRSLLPADGDRSDRHAGLADLEAARGFSERFTASVRQQAAAPEARSTPPGRSWRAAATELGDRVGQLGSRALNQAALTLNSVLRPTPSLRLLGAMAGHAIHQTVAVGVPTFARELVAAAVMHGLKSAPPPVAMGVQAAVGAGNFALQVIREVREGRNPDEAARAYHSLTSEQWAAKTPDEQAAMRRHTAKVSRTLTVMQVASSMTNFALMATAFQEGDRAAALQPLANEVKVGLYAAMRDGLQATFGMVKFQGPPVTGPDGTVTHGPLAPGLSGSAHAFSAVTYAAANSASAFLSDAMMGALVPARSQALGTLLGVAPPPTAMPMTPGEAWGTLAQGAAVSAFANTLAESVDWFQRMQHFVNQTPGAQQSWGPQLTGTDYGRVLDHAQTRTAAFNGVFSVLTAAGRGMAGSDLSPAVQQLLGNAGLGLMIAMLDSPVSGIWQAQAAVRAEPGPTPAATADLELGLPPAAAQQARPSSVDDLD